MRRVPFVLDCWMESGSMPYGQFHYPFENKKEFESSHPADFIAEYTGQLRAWFYVMHVVSNDLFEKSIELLINKLKQKKLELKENLGIEIVKKLRQAVIISPLVTGCVKERLK